MAEVEDVVVADAGPLIALAVAGQIALLDGMFRRCMVPPSVWAEVTGAAEAPGAAIVAAATFIQVVAPTRRDLPDAVRDLDVGETDAILLAQESPSSLLLLDDRNARRVASELHLAFAGTLGLLVRAKRRGFVDRIHPLILAMRANSIYMTDKLVENALRDAGELSRLAARKRRPLAPPSRRPTPS